MYHRDPDFQFLHDRFRICFTNKRMNENDDGDDDDIEFSWAAACLPYAGYQAATQLQDGYQGLEEVRPRKKSLEEEADYTSRGRSRLTKEVLLPVRRMTCYHTYDGKCKCRIKQYLEDMKVGRCKIKIDDEPTSLLPLPHRVIHYAMVEDLFNNGNCLAVCNVSKPMSPRGQDMSVNVEDFFKTLILQEAVNANLKPEQIINRFFTHYCFEISNVDGHWPITYRAIQRKFEEKGYGDVVPHIVFWKLWNKGAAGDCVEPPSRIPGVTILTGYSDNFIKLFLDTEGEVGTEHALESANCGKEYLNLAVVD
ncbi:unnamed protein product [Malus baccata var. baccata]